MAEQKTIVYFALTGNFTDAEIISKELDIKTTETWHIGDKGKHKSSLDFSCWKLSVETQQGYLNINNLTLKIIEKLFDKIDKINELKEKYQLNSIMESIIWIDTNEENSTPFITQELKTIEFLYRTNTKTDFDIYRFNSSMI